MDATNPVDILSAIKNMPLVIDLASITPGTLTYEAAQDMLVDALANVCECYDIVPPSVDGPASIIGFSLLHCNEAGYFKAMAFSYLARCAMYAASYVEEKAGYPNMQQYAFQAVQWAAMGMSDRLARYVLQQFEARAEIAS